MNLWPRSLGAKFGRGVWCETYWLPKADLVELHDGVTVNQGCVVQTHLFHDRVLSMDRVVLRAGSTLGPNSVILPAASLGDHATVGPVSLVMRGEHVPDKTRWTGNPIGPWAEPITPGPNASTRRDRPAGSANRGNRRGQRQSGLALLTLLTVLLALGAAADYTVFALTRHDDAVRHAAPVAAAEPTRKSPPPSPSATARPAPRQVLAPGARGPMVRELQHRLLQLQWFTPPVTGRYDTATRIAVKGFQKKRGLPATGVVSIRTWHRLVGMTRVPTHAIHSPGPGPGE